ncbi:MAG: GNAT family N-acetyltransferase, partial [Verrucomicrobia bacterium]|nr:GNAT family N-acetyltransferase [Verrucomicrobiota bacterium]
VWVRATLTLDLTKDEPALLKDMNHTVRWSIRKSAERGIQMRAGGEDDLGVFHDQVLALCRRRGVRSNMPGKAGLHLLWKQLAPAGQMKLFLAEFEGRPVSSMMVIALGKWARAWRVGWSGEHPKLFPSHACYWAAIQWAKQSGCSHFDFLGVDERDARELLEGRGADHPYHCSITQFKVSFGGTLHVLPGEFCYFPNRALRWAFGFAGDRLLRSPWFLKAASRIAKSRQA